MCKWGLEVGESADADTDVAAAATVAGSCGTGCISGSGSDGNCGDGDRGDADRDLFVIFEPTNIGIVNSGVPQPSICAKRSRYGTPSFFDDTCWMRAFTVVISSLSSILYDHRPPSS